MWIYDFTRHPVDLETEIRKFKEDEGLNDFDALDKCISMASKKAYEDTQRTLKGIGKLEVKKSEALGEIDEEFKSYFGDNPKDEAAFDKWHNKTCEIWVKAFENTDIGTYGKAQKIVNMTFKYLYCCEDIRLKYKAHFEHCHMPLDSYILKWFYREQTHASVKVVKNRMSSWSAINTYKDNNTYLDEKKQYTYMYYQTKIRELLKESKLTLLQTEFIIWPMMKKHLAAEEFYKAYFEDSIREKDFNNKDLDDKIKIIKGLL